MASETVYEVTYTKKLTQKSKKWIDGKAFVLQSQGSSNRFKIILKDEEEKTIESGFYNISQGNIEPDAEIRLGSVLIRFGNLESGNPVRTIDDPTKQSEIEAKKTEVPKFPAFSTPTFIPNQEPKENASSPEMASTKKHPCLDDFRGPPKRSQKNPVPAPKIIKNNVQAKCRAHRNMEEILKFFDIKSETKISDKYSQPPSIIVGDSQDPEVLSDNADPQVSFEQSKSENLKNAEAPVNKSHLTDQTVLDLIWGKQKASPVPNIPISFDNIDTYREAFINALTMELNSKIREVYELYVAALFSAGTRPPFCKQHGPTKFGIDKRGCYFYRCSTCGFYVPIPPDTEIPHPKTIKAIAEVTAFLRSRQIPYFESTIIRTNLQYSINFTSELSDKSDYSKDDLWVVFSDTIKPIFFTATSYGVSRGTRVDIAAFYSDPSQLLQRTKVSAIRLFNVQSEKAALLKLYEVKTELPIIHSILSGANCDGTFCASEDILKRLVTFYVDKYTLNPDQSKVLEAVSGFFRPESPPIVLVHGIFGSGKSRLLTIISMFLDEVLTEIGSDDKILIATTTNVAVDNILSNLDKLGFTNFTRVGSVRKIRKSILPYSTGHTDKESMSDLKDSLNTANSDEKSLISKALQDAEREATTKTCKIDIKRITGVTCAATSFDVMENRVFPFVLLDECSQQTEPSSLIPLSFNCSRLICCGDPQQLPPTLTKPAPNGLGRPMFSRLSKFFPPIMLSYQYRCHPSIASICSTLFYGGRVKSAITEDQRPPIAGLPTICVFDLPNGKEQFVKGSCINNSEAITAVMLVKYLLKNGIDPNEIGVICFYKSQVDAIAQPLSGDDKRPAVNVSTVDAFQGDEKDVIIITTSRTQASSFVETPERINVAISRAKRHLFIVTNVRALMGLEMWSTIISIGVRPPNRMLRLDQAPPDGWAPFELNVAEAEQNK